SLDSGDAPPVLFQAGLQNGTHADFLEQQAAKESSTLSPGSPSYAQPPAPLDANCEPPSLASVLVWMPPPTLQTPKTVYSTSQTLAPRLSWTSL
ncbi:hypothetical protein DFQ27_002516, partial [Actinomortierella ambigua]